MAFVFMGVMRGCRGKMFRGDCAMGTRARLVRKCPCTTFLRKIPVAKDTGTQELRGAAVAKLLGHAAVAEAFLDAASLCSAFQFACNWGGQETESRIILLSNFLCRKINFF